MAKQKKKFITKTCQNVGFYFCTFLNLCSVTDCNLHLSASMLWNSLQFIVLMGCLPRCQFLKRHISNACPVVRTHWEEFFFFFFWPWVIGSLCLSFIDLFQWYLLCSTWLYFTLLKCTLLWSSTFFSREGCVVLMLLSKTWNNDNNNDYFNACSGTLSS